MNRTLPPGDCGDQGRNPRRTSRSANAAPGARGPVRKNQAVAETVEVRVADQNENEKRRARNVAMARKCLVLIRDIAEWGAASWDPEWVGYALQELSQVLLERTGTEGRIFEPLPAGELEGLDKLYVELVFVDGVTQEGKPSHRWH
jgi:hypothetical protein